MSGEQPEPLPVSVVPTEHSSVLDLPEPPAAAAAGGEAAEETTPPRDTAKRAARAEGEPRRYGASMHRTSSFLRLAAKKAQEMDDPWAQYNIHECPAERVRRHKFNPHTREWIVDDAVVKMERESFAQGAMRRCYRMKKLSQQPGRGIHALDWRRATNYVVKEYLQEDSRSRAKALGDVQMQADTAHWAELFSQCNPPKQITMIKSYVIEFFERPGSPFFSVERFVDGEFLKHNSNSGFVDEDAHRNTPQAFSHHSFERSGGRLMVVDVQGVGDLYTDPQIHTLDPPEGDENDGDLGVTGFALFFATHQCNHICEFLRLPPFDMAPAEQRRMHEAVLVASPATLIGAAAAQRTPPPPSAAPRSHSEGLGVHLDIAPADVPEQPTAVARVHLELSKFNLLGRFTDREPDFESAMYHLFRAARGGVPEALSALGKGYVGLSHERLPDPCPLPNDPARALPLLELAATHGDAEAAELAGFAYKDGSFGNEPDPERALVMLEKAFLAAYGGADDLALAHELHAIAAAAAEMCLALGQADAASEWWGSAAEAAMGAMKMGLANKYLMKQSA